MNIPKALKPAFLRTELSQSYSRLWISSASFLYLLFASLQQNIYADLFFKPALVPVFVFLVSALILHSYIKRNPEIVLWRRGASIVADASIVCYGMYLTGPFSGVFYPILLWVVIGNGLRFGAQCLYFALAVSVVGFTLTTVFTPFLWSQLPIAIGMFIGLLLLPLFFAMLLHELKASHRELKAQIKQTSYAASHDMLTGLPNRLMFIETMQSAIHDAKENNTQLALVFIDLDDFKAINDNCGHATGDELLKEVARRIQAKLRNTDTVARLGGDEFVVLFTEVISPEAAMHSAQRLLHIFGEPYEIDDHRIFAAGSVGLSLFPEHGEDIDTLIHHADTAMYKVKRKGGNHVAAFEHA